MKRFLLTLALSVLTALSVCALEAKVISVSGQVEQQRGASWIAVKTGDVLQKGAVISTGFNSEATLNINGTVLKVGALTRMTIEQLADNASKDETQVFIDSGKVQADVSHTENRRNSFKVRSPVATASVRGTFIEMYALGPFSVLAGMADYGPAETLVAEILDAISDDGAQTPYVAPNVFTSALEVGGSYGTPVFEGWSSFIKDSGLPARPEEILSTLVENLGSYTQTLTQRESAGSKASNTEGSSQGGAATVRVVVRSGN